MIILATCLHKKPLSQQWWIGEGLGKYSQHDQQGVGLSYNNSPRVMFFPRILLTILETKHSSFLPGTGFCVFHLPWLWEKELISGMFLELLGI